MHKLHNYKVLKTLMGSQLYILVEPKQLHPVATIFFHREWIELPGNYDSIFITYKILLQEDFKAQENLLRFIH